MSSSHPPHEDDDMIMQMDEDMDVEGEGEDQLIDDDGIVPAPRPGSTPSSTTPLPPTNQNGRRRVGPLGTTQAVVDKSARKREQREREKEQQKMLLAKLIEIFGTCFHSFHEPHLSLRSPLAYIIANASANRFFLQKLAAALVQSNKGRRNFHGSTCQLH
jgi:hypothetical protein